MASRTGRISQRMSRRGITLAVGAAAVAALAACGSDNTTAPITVAAQIGIPTGWTLAANDTTDAAFTDTSNLVVGLEGVSAHGGTYAAYLHGKTLDAIGTIRERIDATPYRGKRVKATAWVDESFLTNAGAFAVGVDAPAARTRSLIAVPAPVGGSDSWHQVSVVFDVPANAVGLSILGSISGSGQMFFDDIALTTVDLSVPLTASANVTGVSDSLSLVAMYSAAHSTLVNADFESGVTAYTGH